MRPSRPSTGTACIQRQCQGSRPSKAGKNTIRVRAPKALARGEDTSRDLNQRPARKPRATGIKKIEIPTYWSQRSLSKAPNRPIQFCAGRDAPGVAAVFREGSRGE